MLGGFAYSLATIANAIFNNSFIALASRTVNVLAWKGGTPDDLVGGKVQVDVRTWLGAGLNALIGGRVDAVASVVSDKTGYSVSAVGDKTGYSLAGTSPGAVHSVQRGTIAITNMDASGTAGITTGGSHQELRYLGIDTNSTAEPISGRVSLSGSTVTANRSTPTNNRTSTIGFEVTNRY